MKNVQVKCDRCGKMVDGLIEESGQFSGATGGFYDVRSGYWAQFSNAGEENICDACMHSDPAYKKVYGGTL